MSHHTNIKRNIFISYHASDKEFVLNLARALEAKSLTVWTRDLHGVVGKRMDHQIEDALEESDIVLFILSQSSADSKALMDEVHTALNNHKTFIPLLIEPCELPKRLKRIQFVDLQTNQSEGIANLFRALALKGHNLSELHQDVMALLSEGEQKLLAKKELAKSKFAAIERRNRRRRLVGIGVATIVVGILAYMTFNYSKKDGDHFDAIQKDYNLFGRHNKDTMDLIEKRFSAHVDSFAYCQHQGLISNVLDEYRYYSKDDDTDTVPNYLKKIDSLQSVIDSLKLGVKKISVHHISY